MIINEHFPAIQGEGQFVGHPTYFIRFSGCNLNCDFCDSKYHIEQNEIELDKLIEDIKQSGIKHITFTGGEPLLQQKQIIEIKKILGSEYKFGLETNGTLIPEHYYNNIACSPKKNQTNEKVIKEISYRINSTFKFVYESKDDLWWEEVIKQCKLKSNQVYIMPEGVTREAQLNKMQEVMEYCLNKGYTFCSRLHILAYDTERGK